MARLTNSPTQTLALDLERRKSYSFRCVVLNNERSPLDLSGCVARFVMKEAEYDGDLYDMTNLIVNSEGVIASPESGEISFSFQAAELDGPPGEYNYSVVLWTADGFSIVLLKGVLNLHPNTESLSVTRTYSAGTANAAVEIVLRGNDVIEVIANTVPQGAGGSNIVGTGRPDNPSTLEARSLALVASAPIGTVFVSLDGSGTGLWAWRKRAAGWFVIEGGPVSWTSLTGVPASFNPSAHNHDLASINGLTAALAAKSAVGHLHSVADVSGLQAVLDGKANVSHNHDLANINGLSAALSAKAAVSHSHVVTDITGLQAVLDGKSATGHTHDDRYFTESESDARFVRTVNGQGPDGSGDVVVSGGGGGGVTDHGALTGRDDDDHPQYALADGTRGSFAATTHSHTAAQISDSTTTGRALIKAATAVAARTAISAAPALGNDDNYVTDAEKAALHSHANKTALDNVSGVNTGDQDLSSYATTTALTSGLSGKADSTHSHVLSDITDYTPPTGIELVSGTVTLDNSGIPIREFYATGTVTIRGITFPAGTSVVFRRTIDGKWGYIVVDDWNATNLADAIIALNPAGYWKLDETAGTTAIDSSGNGYHGTYTGAHTLAGRDGAATFSGGYVEIPDDDVWSVVGANQGFTIFSVAYANAITSTRQRIVTKGAAGQFEWNIEVKESSKAGCVEASVMSPAGTGMMAGTTTTTQPAAVWSAVAVSFPPYAYKAVPAIYRDNNTEQPLATPSWPVEAAPSNGTAPLCLAGRQDGSGPWHGALRHVAIFRTQLTATQIGTLMNAARSEGLIL